MKRLILSMFIVLTVAATFFGLLHPRPIAAETFNPPLTTTWHAQWRGTGDINDVYFIDGQTGYAVGSGGRFMRTRDGGRFWHYEALAGAQNWQAVYFADAQHGWIAGEGGRLWATDSSGDAWQPVTLPYTNTLRALMADANGEVWAAGDGGAVAHGIAAGSWEETFVAPGTDWHSIALDAAGTPCLVGSGGAFYCRAGETWQQVVLPMPAGGAVNLRGIAFAGEHGWIVGNGGYYWHKQGNGAWQLAGPLVSADLYTVAGLPDGRVWVAGSGGHLLFSNDSQTFAAGASQTNSTLRRLAVAADGQQLWVSGENATLSGSTDGGFTWHTLTGGLLVDLYGVHFANEKEGWAVGERFNEIDPQQGSGIILHTQDGGQSWEVQALPEGSGWLRDVTCLSAENCWADGRYGKVFHTEDGGRTWQNTPTGVDTWLHRISFPDTQTGFIGMNRGKVLRTRDGGHHWEMLNPPVDLPIYALDFYSAKIGGAATDDGTVLRTVNGGASWLRINLRKPIDLRAIDYITDKEYWVGGNYGFLLHTADGGKSWNRQEGGGSKHARDVWGIDFLSPQRGLAVGAICPQHANDGHCLGYTEGLILQTFDGRSWHYQRTGALRDPLYVARHNRIYPDKKIDEGTLRDVFFKDRRHAWAVGDGGVILAYRGEPNELYAYPADGHFVADGDLWEWAPTGGLHLDGETADKKIGADLLPPSDLSADLRARWRSDALFFAIQVQDDHVVTSGVQPDRVLLALDGLYDQQTGGGDDHLLAVTAGGTLSDLSGNSAGVRAGVRLTATGYQVEIMVPATLLGGPWQPDRFIGLSLGLDDNDGAGRNVHLISDGPSLTGSNTDFARLTLLGNVVSFQRWRNHYSDFYDTFIRGEWNMKDSLNWNGRTLSVTGGDFHNPLLWMDVSILPTTTVVETATLSLFTTDERSGSGPLLVGAYPLSRTWSYDQATWNQPLNGASWGAPGANDMHSDRWPTPVSQTTVDAITTWFDWDIAAAVQMWTRNPATNHGLIFKSFQNGFNPRYTFTSESHYVPPYDKAHPLLRVRYHLPLPPTPVVTPTPTVTPTATPQRIYLPLLVVPGGN